MVGGDPTGRFNTDNDNDADLPEHSGEGSEMVIPVPEDNGPVSSKERFAEVREKIKAIPNAGPEVAGALEALNALEVETTEEIARLYYESTHDSLTGLNNRRAFLDIVSSRLAEFYKRNEGSKEQSPGSLIFMDLNGFKKINTELGNMIADKVLVEFASLTKHLRKEDVSARLGGDEIVIYLPDSNPEIVAKLIARRVAKILADNPIIVNGKKIDITFAVGSMALPSKLEIPVDTDQKQFLIELINQSLNEAQTREQKAKDVTGHDSIAVSYPDPETGDDVVIGQAVLLKWQNTNNGDTANRRAQDT